MNTLIVDIIFKSANLLVVIIFGVLNLNNKNKK